MKTVIKSEIFWNACKFMLASAICFISCVVQGQTNSDRNGTSWHAQYENIQHSPLPQIIIPKGKNETNGSQRPFLRRLPRPLNQSTSSNPNVKYLQVSVQKQQGKFKSSVYPESSRTNLQSGEGSQLPLLKQQNNNQSKQAEIVSAYKDFLAKVVNFTQEELNKVNTRPLHSNVQKKLYLQWNGNNEKFRPLFALYQNFIDRVSDLINTSVIDTPRREYYGFLGDNDSMKLLQLVGNIAKILLKDEQHIQSILGRLSEMSRDPLIIFPNDNTVVEYLDLKLVEQDFEEMKKRLLAALWFLFCQVAHSHKFL